MNDDRLKELAYAYLFYFSSVDERDIDPDEDKNILKWWHEFPESPEKFKGVISPCINSPSCKIEVLGISQELVDLLISGKAVPIPNPIVLQDSITVRSHTRYRTYGDTKIP